MRILVVSETGDSLSLASHLSTEGHNVTYLCRQSPNAGKGLTDSIVHEGPYTPYSLIVYDSPEHVQEADRKRREGHTVYGPTRFTRAVERDKAYFTDLSRALGWPQDNIQGGINTYLCGIFNGSRFISLYTAFLYKRLMSFGVGPDVGVTGGLGLFTRIPDVTYETFYHPLQETFKKVDYRGPFCLHVHIKQDKYQPRGIMTGTHPLSLLVYENTNLATGEVLSRTLDTRSRPLKPLNDFTSLLSVTAPPYPHSQSGESVTIKGLSQGAFKHFWPTDLTHAEGTFTTTGLRGHIGYITARGSTKAETIKRMYRTVRNFNVPDIQYRSDIGLKLDILLEKLSQWGWIDYRAVKQRRDTWNGYAARKPTLYQDYSSSSVSSNSSQETSPSLSSSKAKT